MEYGMRSFVFALLTGLLLPRFSLSAEDWGGTGTYLDPRWYEIVSDETGNGFKDFRGQSETSLGGLWLYDSVDRKIDIVAGKQVNQRGHVQHRKALTTFANGHTTTEFECIDSVIVRQAVPGNDDLWEWRYGGITGNRSISQDGFSGSVNAEFYSQSLSTPIGAPPATAWSHEFDFDYNVNANEWSVALLGDGIDYCTQGDFEENQSIDFSMLDFDDWDSSQGNIEGITSVGDFVQLVVSFPDPYLDLTHIPLDQEYIDALVPWV
jgi:hypothetical protein